MAWEFKDLAIFHSAWVASHYGSEIVEYQAAGTAEPVPFYAQVNRTSLSVTGALLVGQVEVFVDRGNVPNINPRGDRIRFPRERIPGVTGLDWYQVQDSISDGDGHFILQCRK
jgi:hypothetical protein